MSCAIPRSTTVKLADIPTTVAEEQEAGVTPR
jgi:hypothetical protein